MDSEEQRTIPTAVEMDGNEHLSDLVCPDCAGALRASKKDDHLLILRCRVGHLYAVPELLAAKERRLEQYLWSSVALLDELAALLRDLGCDPARRERAAQDAAAIRRIIEQSQSVRLDDPVTDEGGGIP